MSRSEALANQAAQALGRHVVRAEALHGGDLSGVARLTLEDGGTVVAKGGPFPRTEADMLRRLARSGVPVPDVWAADDHVLILSDIVNDGAAGWDDLGRVLARLHGQGGKHFGWPENYAFGNVRIDNGQGDDWPVFWAEKRLKPGLLYLPKSLATRLSALASDLPARLPAVTPGLLHGDLWDGNILWHHGRVAALIDPACYYGHGEVDLAMLTLFSKPTQAFFDAYRPAPGWRDRQAIYQLWPALMHVRLFGSDYYPMVERLLTAAGV